MRKQQTNANQDRGTALRRTVGTAHELRVATQVKDLDLGLQSPRQLSYPDCRRVRGTRPKIGEIVEVRSAGEILATLDGEGKFEGIPFMPEMLVFCGRRFQVVKYADNTCTDGNPRCLKNTIHLDELRCNGSAHRDCQARCLLFWKEAWIKRIAPEGATATIKPDGLHSSISAGNSATALLGSHTEGSGGTMSCQATELRSATCPLEGGLAQYFGTISRDLRAQRISWPDLGRLLMWVRQKTIWSAFVWWARAPWNSKRYLKTPSRSLGVQPGDLVKVRKTWEILRTLDRRGCNRGLRFTPEMLRFCGQRCRVLSRLERRINEVDGQLVEFGNDCILLEDVICKGQRTFCSRSEYHYWREIWLERC
jgi:hypothetical protein